MKTAPDPKAYRRSIIELCKRIAHFDGCREISVADDNGIGEDYWSHEIEDSIGDLEEIIESYPW